MQLSWSSNNVGDIVTLFSQQLSHPVWLYLTLYFPCVSIFSSVRKGTGALTADLCIMLLSSSQHMVYPFRIDQRKTTEIAKNRRRLQGQRALLSFRTKDEAVCRVYYLSRRTWAWAVDVVLWFFFAIANWRVLPGLCTGHERAVLVLLLKICIRCLSRTPRLHSTELLLCFVDSPLFWISDWCSLDYFL
jgi:hypothetical protein